MEIKIEREKRDLIKFMKRKAEKSGLECTVEGEKLVVQTKIDDTALIPVPVSFKGKITDAENGVIIKGKFSNGFYLTTLVILAAVLILARFAWSIYKMQMDNIILCLVVTILLVVVCAVTNVKGKPVRNTILEFLNGLEKK